MMQRRRLACEVGIVLIVAGATIMAHAQTPSPPPRPPASTMAPESHGSAIDLDIPMPPPRPAALPSAAPSPPVAPPAPPVAASPASPSAPPVPRVASEKDLAICKALLDSGTVVAKMLPPISGAGECGIEAPVSLESIVLDSKSTVKFSPSTAIRCDLAAALARWVREDVVPVMTAQGMSLERITDADAYSCRSRNHVAGAKLSEHARGNAIDLAAFVVSPSRTISLTSVEATPFLPGIRSSACARFTTILGPGSDGFHNNHIHLDLEDRRTHGTLCEWNLTPAGPAPAADQKRP